jgi:hypothetical protein
MNRIDRFLGLIDEPAAEPAGQQGEDLVEPLRDLARALREKAQVGAEVQASQDGFTHHLALWPLHRPAYKSLMVTLHVTQGRGTVYSTTPFPFTRAEELGEWLEKFVQLPEFRRSLEQLRRLALEPVDGRIERENGMATLVTVSPEQQRILCESVRGRQLDLELELREGEPSPQRNELSTLSSAGVRFDIDPGSVVLVGRNVHLSVIKR